MYFIFSWFNGVIVFCRAGSCDRVTPEGLLLTISDSVNTQSMSLSAQLPGSPCNLAFANFKLSTPFMNALKKQWTLEQYVISRHTHV